MDETKLVIVIRKDLKMRRGKEIAQGCHAAQEFLLDDSKLSKVELEWKHTGRKIVCVVVDSETELLNIIRQCKDLGIQCRLIIDSGRTEFNGVPTPTCCAVGPDRSSLIDRVTGKLKLY